MSEVATTELEATFGRAARRVRWRLWLRRTLSAGAIGLAAGAPMAAALWWFRQGELRPLAAGLGLLGALVGAALASRKRWSDEEVALYLDDKIGSIAAGMEADVIVLDLKSTPLIEYRMRYCNDIHDALFIQMTLADDRAIRATYVAGQIAHERCGAI